MPLLHNFSDKPTPPSQADGDSRYDFILDPPKKAGKPLLPGFNLTLTQVLVAAGIIAVLLLFLGIILTLSRGGNDNRPALTGVARDQQEIIRVSRLGQKQVESDDLKNFASTAITTTTSAQQELIDHLGRRGSKVTSKQLATSQNSRNDEILGAAQAASTYDAAFKSVMQSLLADYVISLEQAAAGTAAKARSEKALVNRNLQAAELLQQQLGQ